MTQRQDGFIRLRVACFLRQIKMMESTRSKAGATLEELSSLLSDSVTTPSHSEVKHPPLDESSESSNDDDSKAQKKEDPVTPSPLADDSSSSSENGLFSQEALEQHFAFREELLSRLEANKSLADEEMVAIRQQEETFRVAAMTILAPSKDKQAPVTFLSSLLFEFRYTVPALFKLTLYCLAYCGTDSLLNTIIVECAKKTDNLDLVYLFVLAFSLFLSRITGGVWMFSSSEARQIVETEYETFLMWRWWSRESHYNLREACNMLSFFMCFVAVFYFYQGHLLRPFDSRNNMLEGLPSVQQGVTTSISELLETKLLGYDLVAERRVEEAEEYCDQATNLTIQDDVYLRSRLSVDSYNGLLGDSGTVLVSATSYILYSVLVSTCSIAILKKRGLTFWVMEE